MLEVKTVLLVIMRFMLSSEVCVHVHVCVCLSIECDNY